MFSIGAISGVLELQGVAAFEAGNSGAQRSLSLTADAAERTGAAIGVTEKAMASSSRTATTASAGSAKLRSAQLQLVAAQERLTALLADEDVALGRLASAEASVIRANQRVIASNPANSIRATTTAAAESGTAMSGAATKFAGFASTAAKLGLAVGVFELVRKAIDIGKEAAAFDKQMTMIQTNANASAAEVKSMSSAVLQLAGPVATSPEELALALYHVEQNGLRGSKALATLTISAKGAQVGAANLEETTNAMTAAVASGIPGVKDMDQAMGALIATVGTGDMKMSDLNEALGSGMLVKVKAYGLSLRDVGAALAVFGDNNIRGADAATMVVQAVQAMAKPAAGGAKALGDIGLSVDALKTDMQKGGLNQAIQDLDSHLKAAGITGTETGGFLLNAFGRKQAAGVGVLLGQVDRLESKYAELDKGSASFGSRWDETTKTTSFAFKRLGAEAEAAGISLMHKVTPALTTAAWWLGTSLPHAIGETQKVLLPLEREVGGAFLVAWHAAAAVLGVVGPALEDVGHFLSENKFLVQAVVTPVLAMWAAYKGYQLATVAIDAVRFRMAAMSASGANMLADTRRYGAGVQATFAGNATEAELSAMIQQQAFAEIEAAALQDAAVQDRAAAMKAVALADEAAASTAASDEEIAAADAAAEAALAQARASVLAARTSSAAAEAAAAAIAAAGPEAAVGWSAMLGPIGLVAIGVTTLISLFGGGASAADEVTQAVSGLTSALNADSNALGDHVRHQIEDNLASADAYQLALKLGISQKTLTDAAMGNADALRQVKSALDAGQRGSDSLKLATLVVANAVGVQSKALKQAVTDQKDKAAADGKSTDAIGTNTSATKANTAANQSLTVSLQWVVDAHGKITQAMVEDGHATDIATAAMDAQRISSGLLKSALDLLNGVALSKEQADNQAAQAQYGFVDAMKAAAKAGTAGAHSINTNTEAGLANRQNLVTWITALQAQAQAQADANAKTMSSPAAIAAANAALKKNEDHLLAVAVQAGASKTEVQKLIDSFGVVAQVKAAPKIDLNAAAAASKLATIRSQLGDLNGTSVAVSVYVNDTVASAKLARDKAALRALATSPYAEGGSVGDGWFTVGEQGYELGYKRGSSVEIFSNSQSQKMTGHAEVPGFASGTAGAGLMAPTSTVSRAASLVAAAPSGSVSVADLTPSSGASASLHPDVLAALSRAGGSPHVEVRVFVGNEEITQIARTEVRLANDASAREYSLIGGWE